VRRRHDPVPKSAAADLERREEEWVAVGGGQRRESFERGAGDRMWTDARHTLIDRFDV
jgi:hypothetical protein